jgi:hypothetical protein
MAGKSNIIVLSLVSGGDIFDPPIEEVMIDSFWKKNWQRQKNFTNSQQICQKADGAVGILSFNRC